MTPRFALKAATTNIHDDLDQRLATLRLDQPDDYRCFLKIQARVVPPLETALDRAGLGALVPDWATHRRTQALEDDLSDLGAELPPPAAVPAFSSAGAMLGAAYVLEGSRLGGRVLSRGLAPGMPRRFIAAEGRGPWPSLVAALDQYLYPPEQLGEAEQAARACFALFSQAAHEVGL